MGALNTFEGTIDFFRYNKQHLKTIHTDDSSFLMRLAGRSNRRKSVPVYKMSIVLSLLLDNDSKKRFNFSVTSDAENMPFFDLRNGDRVKVTCNRDDSVREIINLTNNQRYELE